MDIKSEKIKKMIIILVFILVVIFIMILISLFSKNDSNDENLNVNNTINDVVQNTNQNTTNNINENTVNEEKTEEVLKQISDTKSYFIIKNIVDQYYDSNELNEPSKLMDKEVINKLKLTDENYKQFNNFDLPIFRIDEIFKQKINDNTALYVVYHSFGIDKSNLNQSVIWVKVNKKQKDFSIYPYEYIKLNNQTGLKENDIIKISTNEIEKSDFNNYNETKIDADICMKELFERYKFDVLVDNEHLYSTLNEEYKKLKYPQYKDLEQYIVNNKNDLYLDKVSEYKATNQTSFVEYIVKCTSNRSVVFKAKNMMNYNIELDSYTFTQEQEKYSGLLPAAQARYCVDRVIQSVNYKDYNFIYERLNPVQKNNYYRDIDTFKDFIDKSFYDENSYEVEEDYLILSDDVYQFDVKVTDSTGKDFSYKKLKMAVTLRDNGEFYVSMINDN